mmetsp:Transcript_168122/g.408645  ORF Transcript_168122/g.408645 Transcript_168122/m.408645 type:complete len:228 (-) Transcript_168122:63-746(-)
MDDGGMGGMDDHMGGGGMDDHMGGGGMDNTQNPCLAGMDHHMMGPAPSFGPTITAVVQAPSEGVYQLFGTVARGDHLLLPSFAFVVGDEGDDFSADISGSAATCTQVYGTEAPDDDDDHHGHHHGHDDADADDAADDDATDAASPDGQETGPDTPDDDDSGMGGGIIALIVIVAVLALGIFLAWFAGVGPFGGDGAAGEEAKDAGETDVLAAHSNPMHQTVEMGTKG